MLGTRNDPVMECVEVSHEGFDAEARTLAEDGDPDGPTRFVFRDEGGKLYAYEASEGVDPNAFAVGASYHVNPAKVKKA